MAGPAISTWLLAAAALVLAPAPSSAAPLKPDVRVYGSAWVDEKTGDMHGMEVELRLQTPTSAVVTWCQTGCYGGKVVPVRLSGRRISFTVAWDGLVDQDGRPAKPMTTRYVGDLSERMLILSSPDRPRTWREHLTRQPHPRPGQTAWLACGKPEC